MELWLAVFLLSLESRRVWAGPMPLNAELIQQGLPVTKAPDAIHIRQASEQLVSTCGFRNGNLSQPWMAPNGFQCATDPAGGYFGFCGDDTVPSSCKPLRGCEDNHGCASGCGDSTRMKQCTASAMDFCRSDLLVAGTDASSTYTYYVCADHATQQVISAFSAFVTESFAFSVTTAEPSVPATPASTASTESTASATSVSASAASTSDPSLNTATGAPAQTSAPAVVPTKRSSSNVGAIVGGVIGGLALILATAIAFVVLRRKGKTESNTPEPVTEITSPQPPEYSEKGDRYGYLHEMEHPPTELTVQDRGPLFVSELAADDEVTVKRNKTIRTTQLSTFKYGTRGIDDRNTREQTEEGREAGPALQRRETSAAQELQVSPLEDPRSPEPNEPSRIGIGDNERARSGGDQVDAM